MLAPAGTKERGTCVPGGSLHVSTARLELLRKMLQHWFTRGKTTHHEQHSMIHWVIIASLAAPHIGKTTRSNAMLRHSDGKRNAEGWGASARASVQPECHPPCVVKLVSCSVAPEMP